MYARGWSWPGEIKAANGIVRRASKSKKLRASDRTGYYETVLALVEPFEDGNAKDRPSRF
ncbi:MAG: hypothetical protein DMG32_22005 [Acidobacteria bacterium]|nr:MAG: hypothetical protein DMG32_22005 [Acidobacteriota bacterium]